ncbi:hypothetical protein ABBQ38_001588 [Trebouxia sp. C0009 RCD-2024]
MACLCVGSQAVFGTGALPRRVFSRPARISRLTVRSASGAHSGNLFFVANNVFKVKKEGCQQFEDTWKNRESNLKDTPGFVRFALLKGDEEGEYISQSTWASREDFKNWTQSQNFAKAHGKSEGAHGEKPKESKRSGMAELMDGPPRPRFYEAVTVTEL